MKSLLIKVVTGLVMLMSYCNSQAALIRYENTDTSSTIYGSYEYDNVLKTFFGIALKTNFTKLQGPAEVDVDPASRQSLVSADGSRPDTYYLFTSGVSFSSDFPGFLIVDKFGRWELVRGGEMLDYVDGTNGPEVGNLIFFTPSQGSISNVPEPDIFSMLLISPIILLARNKKLFKN